MKKMKKLASLVLAMAMALSLAVPAMAAEETGSEETGSITINDAVVGQTYTVYQILELESYNATSGAYAYKATTAWGNFINSKEIKDVYVSVDDQGYVTWVTNASAADFAKAAQAYAKVNSIAPSADAITAIGTTVKFENLNLGYYLVDTTLGTLCSLDTTNPNVVMEEKNEGPTVTKEVQEDSNSTWGETNDADIGQTVNFKATITVQKGAENYIMHDKMSAGLTYTGVTAVKIGEDAVPAGNYTVKTQTCAEDCTFEVAFDNAYIKTLTPGTKIVVYYSATLNENAVVGLPGNPNDVRLQYGDKNHPTYTPWKETITYTWDMGVLKFANGNKKNVLADAEFVLLKEEDSKVATIANGKVTGWFNVPSANEDGTIPWPENTKLTTGADGKIAIKGLDADTYNLREIKAPAGYNKLDRDVTVVITGADNSGETLTYTQVVAEVNNNSGTELPSTGGMGTTLFYALGAVLVIGAGVAMVTKKRMA